MFLYIIKIGLIASVFAWSYVAMGALVILGAYRFCIGEDAFEPRLRYGGVLYFLGSMFGIFLGGTLLTALWSLTGIFNG